MKKTPLVDCTHWQPDFERLLGTVRDCVTHGQLIDIREYMRLYRVARRGFFVSSMLISPCEGSS